MKKKRDENSLKNSLQSLLRAWICKVHNLH